MEGYYKQRQQQVWLKKKKKGWNKRLLHHFSAKQIPMASIIYMASSKIFILQFKDLHDTVPCYLFRHISVHPSSHYDLQMYWIASLPCTWKVISHFCAILYVILYHLVIFLFPKHSSYHLSIFYFSSEVNINIISWVIPSWKWCIPALWSSKIWLTQIPFQMSYI